MVAACLANDGADILLTNIPHISDVDVMCKILTKLGKKINLKDGQLVIGGSIKEYEAPIDESNKIRASIYCVGMLLGVAGKAVSGMPGGDKIGARPIDIHIKAFEKLGAKCTIDEGIVSAEAPDGLLGNYMYLRFPSVGATCNIILASVKADGKTIIENAAKEPEVVDLCNLLIKMGASIHGAGTDRIVIKGTKHIHGGVEHEIITDRIEIGVIMVATAITGGEVRIPNAIARHNRPLISTLNNQNITCNDEDGGIRICSNGIIDSFNVNMMPFPGLATDLQPLMTVLATQACGESIITDNVFPERFQYIYELVRMGADIDHFGNLVRVKGRCELLGMQVEGTDIRAVTALICGGLIAKGQTVVEGVKHIERGYVDFDQKLRSLGADIEIR